MTYRPPGLKSDAARVAAIRDLLPSSLGSAEIRGEIAAEVRARSVFVSRAANVVFLSRVKEVVTAVSNGSLDKASAQLALLETLRGIGYTPEGGFPDDPAGAVPPALAGTLQDITSRRRISLIVDTQVAMMNGRGYQLRGMGTERMRQFPAWELVRSLSRDVPRDWGGSHNGTPPVRHGQPDLRSRWTIAGGKLAGGRMIALKGDPVWGELGGSGNFDDALDVDHPPFAFNSGMGWDELDRSECAALGIAGPDGETVAQWLAMEHPVIAMAPPVISVRGADPELVRAMTAATPATTVGHAITTPANAAAAEERIQVLEKRSADRLAAAIARRKAEYEARQK